MKQIKSWRMVSVISGAILLGAWSALSVKAQSYDSIIQTNNPIDWWKFTETNVSPAVNLISNLGSVGARGNGYVANGALTGTNGIVGNAVLLLNSGSSPASVVTRIDIPNVAALNPPPPFTIEFWAQPHSVSTDSTGVCVLSSMSPFPGTTSRSGYLVYENTSAYTFRIGGQNSYSATATSTTKPAAGVWAHIVAEFDGTNATIYVNGVSNGTGKASVSAPFHANNLVATRLGGTSLNATAGYLVAGGGIFPEGNRGFDGAIDEFAVYNTLLSSNTVLAHYNAALSNAAGYDALILASSPVGYWNCDEAAYTTPAISNTFAADSGSVGDNGSNTLGTVAVQPGVTGSNSIDKSVFYNGAAGSLVLNTNVTPPDVAGLPMSLVAWIKPASFDYVMNVIAQGYDPSTMAETFLRVGDGYDWASFNPNNAGGDDNTNLIDGVVYYQIGTYNGGGDYVTADFPAPAGDLGHWVFLAGTYDGANWNLYRNGALVAQFADGGVGPAEVAPNPWSVGSRSNPNQYLGLFFVGNIAEPAIFTNALSAATISNLYNSVGIPPVITQAPVAPVPAYLGSAATFSVWADGPGKLSYQWYSNSVAVAGKTATNFSLVGLVPADSATYSVVVTNSYGSVTSTVVLAVTNSLPPAVVVPTPEARWIGSPFSFGLASVPTIQLTYQWQFDGTNITGATGSNYSATTLASSAGSYTVILSNSLSVATSSVALLVPLTVPTNTTYPSNILADHPLSYFRLDEKSGTVANDYAGGNNGNYYGVQLGVPGYSLIDTDTAVYFSGAVNDYLGDIGPTTLSFPGTTAEFTIEAWANGAANQVVGSAVVVKGNGNNGGAANQQFAIAVGSTGYEFFVTNPKNAASTAQSTIVPDGNWHLLDGVCDFAGGNLTLYVDGVQAAQTSTPSLGLISSTAGISIGAERSGVLPNYDLPYAGTVDEVAIYGYPLTAAQIANHFAARYGPSTPPFITAQPVSVTNYVGLPVSMTVNAAGTVPLSYQWNKVGSGPVPGATGTTFSIASLTAGNAGTYTVGITNTINGNVVTGLLSAPVTITVLQPPTNPPVIPGLVLHLPFDGNLIDVTGRGNNGTNLASGGAPLITNNYVSGQIGKAFTFQTTVGATTTNANYATLGYRPDLQFGTNSFTVSMWIELPPNYVLYDLPFFCDVVGSTFTAPGYCFEPSFGVTVGTTIGQPGGWGFSVLDANGNGVGDYGPVGSINDGNWHSLVYVINTALGSAGATVYLDGVASPGTVEAGTTTAGIGNINNTNYATIGQDPSGLYEGGLAESQAAGTINISIDDLCVWKRALTPVEAASIFEAGSVNQLSVTDYPNLTIQEIAGPKVVLTWNQGALQYTTNLPGPWTTLTNASPYTNTPTGASLFYRVNY